MKIGDKIKCTDSWDSNSLNKGSFYSIVDINQYNNIQVQELFGDENILAHYYKPERFILVKDLVKEKVKVKNIDWVNKKYKTRNGNDVNLYCLSNSREYPVIGEYCENGVWSNESWTLDGRVFIDSETSEYDLVEVKTQEVIDCGGFEVTVYADGSIHLLGKESHCLNECINIEDMSKIFAAWKDFIIIKF